MSTTGNPLDIAITGEGFLQVQDADGNIYYTKAGMLDIDSNGNLIDSNGNFVLGTSGNPVGKAAGSSKITFNIPSVDAAAASATNTINGINIPLSLPTRTRMQT
jgi:flagellar hook protein FlgE